jgi:hypothetical protein
VAEISPAGESGGAGVEVSQTPVCDFLVSSPDYNQLGLREIE